MTSDRVAAAAKVIDTEHVKSMRNMRLPNPSKLARALDAAGLLAPEMQEEWGVTGQWTPHIEWFSDRDSAERFMKKVSPADPRLVRRYVTEVIEDD